MEQIIIDRIAKENVFINDYDVEFYSHDNAPSLDEQTKMWLLFKKKSAKEDQDGGATLISFTGLPNYVIFYFGDKKRLVLRDQRMNTVLIREDFNIMDNENNN